MEHDPLAEETEEDPFEGVPADGGDELVEQGELDGYNPSEDRDPLEDPVDEPEPEPEPEVEEDSTEPEPEPEEDPEPEPEPEPEQAQAQTKEEPKRGRKGKGRGKGGNRSAERDYMVIECDADENPLSVVAVVSARDDKTARRTAFQGMEGEEAILVAVPARYWKVRRMRAKTRQVKDIEEE